MPCDRIQTLSQSIFLPVRLWLAAAFLLVMPSESLGQQDIDILPTKRPKSPESSVEAATPPNSESQTSSTEILNEQAVQLVQQLRGAHSLPALWAMRHDLPSPQLPAGRTILACSGVRKEGLNTKAQMTDLLHLGSCTKAMTALMIAQDISAGHLAWDTTLAEALPDDKELADSPWAQITISQMLRHRSGFPANAPWQTIHDQIPDTPIAARSAVARWLANQSVPKETEYLYSNVNYAILGHILEVRVSRPWEQLIQERLFEPLNIQHAGFGPVIGAREDDQPWGHRTDASLSGIFGKALSSLFSNGNPRVNHRPTRRDNPVPLGPAGRVHMPMEQWAKFVSIFASKQAPTQLLAIDQTSWETLTDPGDEGHYAGGWVLAQRDWAGGKALMHTGSNTSWFCVAWVAPEKNFFVLAATNCYDSTAAEACDQAIAGLIMIDDATQ